jgi:hydrogenase maturation protease
MSVRSTGVGTRLVVGLGNRDRGDDGAGPEVAARLTGALPGVRVVEHEDPTTLMDLWDGTDLVVIVDAVRSGHRPGTLVVVEAGGDAGPLPAEPWAPTGRGGTHALGLAAVLELARALDRLPRRVVVVGIEVAEVGHGAPMCAEVAAAVPAAVEAVVALAEPSGGGR